MILQLARDFYFYVIDNINKNMTRRHHTLELKNNMFNGTMRVAIKGPTHTKEELDRMRALQAGGLDRFALLPGADSTSQIREGFSAQTYNQLRHLRQEPYDRRTARAERTEWRPLEVVDLDSKYTEKMCDVLDGLQAEGSINMFTP